MNLEKLTLPLDVASSSFNAGVAAAAAGVTALIGTMGAAVKATFNWAAELDSIQDVIGGTNDQAAALNFVLRKSGVETTKFTSGLTIMSKGLVKADGSLDTVGKELKDFGINVLDANGAVKDQNQLVAEISDKYNSFSTQQERVNFLTAVFGRSGAELIDFFDTLAGEGGIDAVTEKVERLGLVIDPGRYEKFTRSLEELKLVGLGLAVGFTESVMPAFERFLEIITGPGTLGEKAGTLLSEIDTFVGNAVDGFATSIDNWVAGGGPEELTNKLVSWIENIGEGDQSKILTAAGHLITALATALGEIDWAEIGITIDTKMAEVFDNVEWSQGGESFGNAVEEFFSTGFSQGVEDFKNGQMPASLASLGEGINQFFLSATGAGKFGGWGAFFDAWGVQIKDGYLRTRQLWLEKAQEFFVHALDVFIQKTNEYFNNWKIAWTVKIKEWGAAVYNEVVSQINKIIAAFNRIPGLPNIAPLGAIGTAETPSGTIRGDNRRASGGAVIGRQSYSVSEFYRPERFTPSTNGRIDPIDNGSDVISALTLIMQQFADEIARSNRVVFEKVGRR